MGAEGAGGFGASGTYAEVSDPSASANPILWLSSGGLFTVEAGRAFTIPGEAPADSPARRAAAGSNPQDTDGGAHPQNIFRLHTRGVFANPIQRLVFVVRQVNLSDSPNRTASNGVFLRQRFSGPDVYSAGVRVDGLAVVIKERSGRFTRLAGVPVFPGSYDRAGNPNLIPARPVEIQSATRTNGDGSVTIDLAVDGRAVLTAADTGAGGSEPIRAPGFAGIRTDFMDVEFDAYSVEEQ